MAKSPVSKAGLASMAASAMLLLAFGLAGCAGSAGSTGAGHSGDYKDGTYTGESSVLDASTDGDGYVIATITVEGGKISAADLQALEVDGTPKDENYGKDGAFYAVAQKVVSCIDDYAEALVDAGSPDGVDVISGATFLHDQVVEAAENALDSAR